MISEYLSVGDKLELQKLKTRDNEPISDRIYLSQLLDFLENDKAKIAMPIDKGRIIPLTIGDKYILCFYTSKGLFQCKAVITDRYKSQNVYIHEIQFLSELEKFQRRQFYRLECNLDITYHIITEAEKLLDSQMKEDSFLNETDKAICRDTLDSYRKTWYKGAVTDISGGGARFNSNMLIDQSDPVLLKLNLDDRKNHIVPVNVISSNKMTNRPDFYEHRVQFNHISIEEREAIIKFIFEQDRRKRRREKGLD
jgi:c-di-GMP-binding flagellar brake protein YcgR